MAFSETLKAAVRKKAHLSCCMCHTFGVEVHHIIPQAEGGPDTEDNAAPLCPSCHETYGANPTKRKTVTEAREVWYEICAKRYASDADRIERLISLVEGIIPALPAYQEYLTRITNQSTIIEVPSARVHVEAFPPTVAITASDSGTISAIESATIKVSEGQKGEADKVNLRQGTRSEPEILEALEKLFDQIWYNDYLRWRDKHQRALAADPLVAQSMEDDAIAMVVKYSDDPEPLGLRTDFDWGVLKGKLAALRWILGEEWYKVKAEDDGDPM